MNKGRFIKNKYIKNVEFSRAVLWKTREISLPPYIANQFKHRKTKEIIFDDRIKGERWKASYDTLKEHHTFKKEGQEYQYYFPIDVFKKTKIKKYGN